MFVQVIKGKTSDAAALTAQGQRWADEVRPGAVGHLGGTFGVADDGTFFVIARFEDEAAAQANAQRPEQTAWYEGFAALVQGEPTFRQSSDVSLLHDGPSSAAGFVQILEGTAPDRAKAEAAEGPEVAALLRQQRPDLLGALRVWLDGGDYIEAAYFTSEADARSGEASPEFEGPHTDFAALFGEPTYTDLPNPQHS